jgi:ATP-dependent Clp protease ATP-binding subunit ClpA
MNGPNASSVNRKKKNKHSEDSLISELCRKVIGQEHVMRIIAPYVRMYGAGLAPEGRPAGVFLLLGPTGTGKTRTVEALAEVLHGSRKNLLRIDCGEYQMDHEVAKLIGAPPGYLGHRETQPVLSQAKLAAVTSSHSSLSIVLFDEIEKAAPSLTRLLLGVLDKAALRLGDNNVVTFERSLVFLTSNVGARSIQRALSGGIGFLGKDVNTEDHAESKLHQIALQAARRDFSPEFLNRVDAAVTYHPLSEDALTRILDLHLNELQDHIERRLGTRAFRVNVTKRGRDFLLERGTSSEYGAREIRRAVQRYVAHPVSLLVAAERVRPGSIVKIDIPETDTGLTARAA